MGVWKPNTPGRMADTGMMRWPINFPPSSNTAILKEASVGRTTWRNVINARVNHLSETERKQTINSKIHGFSPNATTNIYYSSLYMLLKHFCKIDWTFISISISCLNRNVITLSHLLEDNGLLFPDRVNGIALRCLGLESFPLGIHW